MRLARWLAVSAVVSGGVVLASFTGCGGGGSNSVTPPGGDDGGNDATSSDAELTQDSTKAMCGNGVKEAPEQCDDGAKNGTAGDSCTSDCNWVCSSDGGTSCNNSDPCTGTATCTANHTCMTGAPPGDGTSCGTGMICRNMTCSPSVCGDGFVTSPEECDDGSKNGTTGDGCSASCTFVCVTSDPARNCAPTDPCAGQGTCNGTTHVCTAGTPEANGTACGMGADGGVADAAAGSVCKGGVCVSPQCGDGILESGEQCDFGASNGPGTGCEANCTFSCTLAPNSCVTADLCAGTNTCTAITMGTSPGQKCEVGTPPANGTACMNGGKCMNGVCQTANCGNGKVDTGEQCDWGTAKNVAGSGCNPDCTFSCTITPTDSCPGSALCSATPEKCTVVAGPTGTPTGDNGQKCDPGTVLAACASCGGANICVSNVCKANTCGDGCVVAPETCDPPNGTTCGPTCKKIVCGNGTVEGSEQCDDSNTTNLDGCDSNCNFEQEQRATSLSINGATDAFCTKNALGATALTSLGRSQIQTSINTDLGTGQISVMFQFLGSAPPAPADLTGTTGNVVLGSLAGSPEYGDAGAYSGTSDLDWWYLVAPSTINASRLPNSTLNGTYTSKALNAGPGDLGISLVLQGSLANLEMWNATVKAAIGGTSAPKASTGLPPGHLAAEHDKAGLVSFGSTTGGELCGDITAQSLKAVAVPAQIAKGGATACSQNYLTGTNSLLDVLVGGCTVFLSVVNATQPDQQNPAVTFPAGTVPAYKLSASGANKVIDTCKDKNGTVVPIATCLAGLGYSSAFSFATDRVIVK